MDKFHDHLRGMPDGPRLLYRTRHIFLLFAGLVNIAIATYVRPSRSRSREIAQRVGSALIVGACVSFLAGFVYEPARQDLRTPFSHWGTYLTVGGIFLHLLGGA
jgi:hypothetical protein